MSEEERGTVCPFSLLCFALLCFLLTYFIGSRWIDGWYGMMIGVDVRETLGVGVAVYRDWVG